MISIIHKTEFLEHVTICRRWDQLND